MLIMNHDKTICGEYTRLRVRRNFGGKDTQKFALVGRVDSYGGDDLLAFYPTQEEAIAMLKKIFAAYEAGDKTFAI